MRSFAQTTFSLTFVILLFSSVCVSGKREKTKTFLTKYTEQKRTYCDFQGFEILPGSKWSTPDGCVRCKCKKRFLDCKLITKRKKKQGNMGCFF